MPRRYHRRTTGIRIGVVTDNHIDDTNHESMAQTAVEWLINEGIDVLCNCGDMDERPNAVQTWSEYFSGVSAFTDWIAGGGVYLVTLGNHDTETPNGATTNGPNPYLTCMKTFKHLFRGVPYYAYDYGDVRLIFTANVSDYLTGGGNSAYPNCSPPGVLDQANPDFTGITIENSAQRRWLDRVSSGNHIWKMVFGHRAWWSPFDSDPRKMNKEARPALITPVNNGVDIVWQGDIHVGSFSGKWLPEPPDHETYVGDAGVGCYSCTLAGGYFVRPIDVSKLPGYLGGDVDDAANSSTVHWAESSGLSEGLTHGAHIEIFGNQAYLRIFSCSDLEPSGSIKFSRTLYQNPGV